MRAWIIRRMVLAIAGMFGSKVHEDFDLTESAEVLYGEGVLMMATGFVFADYDEAVGLYLIKYRPNMKENRYGRYN